VIRKNRGNYPMPTRIKPLAEVGKTPKPGESGTLPRLKKTNIYPVRYKGQEKQESQTAAAGHWGILAKNDDVHRHDVTQKWRDWEPGNREKPLLRENDSYCVLARALKDRQTGRKHYLS